jgi:sugar phosphate isomerase/epimerase
MLKVHKEMESRIGKETIKVGLRLAPHPHVNSLVQTQHEVDLLMKETDPTYVWLTADTSHLVLGGLVPMEVLTTYWPRIAAIHYKGAPTKLKGSRVVAVPRLSQLRTRAGLSAHETNIRDSIARMIDDGLLPWGQCCAVTHMPTDDVMWFEIQCETTYSKGGEVHPLLAMWSLLIPGGLLALALRSRQPAEIQPPARRQSFS